MPDSTHDAAARPADTNHIWRHDVAPRDVDEGLRSLWCEVARSAPGVTRALMSNLIVYTHAGAGAPLDDEIQEVAREHPSRILRIAHDPTAAAAAPTTAVQIHAIGHGGGHVGIEEIDVRVGADTAGLASLVRRLVLGDLPTALWWTAPVGPQGAPVDELMAVSRQIVYDSSDWPDSVRTAANVLRLRSRPDPPELADLAWRRVQPFQRAMAHATDLSSCKGTLGRVRALMLSAAPADLSSLWLTLGWLAAQLGWQPLERRTVGPIDEVVRFDSADGPLDVTVKTDNRDHGVTASVYSEGAGDIASMRVEWVGEGIVVTYGIDAPAFSLAAPHRSRASLVAAELRDLRVDERFLAALHTLDRIEAR